MSLQAERVEPKVMVRDQQLSFMEKLASSNDAQDHEGCIQSICCQRKKWCWYQYRNNCSNAMWKTLPKGRSRVLCANLSNTLLLLWTKCRNFKVPLTFLRFQNVDGHAFPLFCSWSAGVGLWCKPNWYNCPAIFAGVKLLEVMRRRQSPPIRELQSSWWLENTAWFLGK